MDSAPPTAWKSRLRLAPAIFLGGWFLLTGAAKALDPVGFAAVIEGYGILTGVRLTRMLAWGIITAEISVGACLLLGVARRAALAAAGAMLLIFTAATARAWASGAVHDCGCFGPLLERTPGQTLVQDLILLAVVTWALMSRAPLQPARRWRTALAGAAALAGILAPPAVAGLAPPLAEGRTLTELGIEAYLPLDPEPRTLFGFLEPLAPGSGSRALDAVARSGVRVLALSSADAEAIETFRWTAGPSFDIITVPRKLLRRLSDDRGGAFLLLDGRVADIWRDRVPGADEVNSGGSSPVRSGAAGAGAQETAHGAGDGRDR